VARAWQKPHGQSYWSCLLLASASDEASALDVELASDVELDEASASGAASDEVLASGLDEASALGSDAESGLEWALDVELASAG
jgi:hypothetical protein